MRIEVWSDLVCPFCYLGIKELTNAITGFEYGDQVELVWRAFELDPGAGVTGQDATSYVVAKYQLSDVEAAAQQAQLTTRAAEAGLDFDWQHTQIANTLDAHRLIKFAATHRLADAVVERLLRAVFVEGALISDRELLVRLGAEAGLDAEQVQAMLTGIDYVEQIRTDEQLASGYGIDGVPFFLFDGKWAISGAQSAELFTDALNTVWAETHRPQFLTLGDAFDQGSGGGCCGGGGCGCRPS